MKYWKKITFKDTLKPGDILMCISSSMSSVVVVKKCSEMTGVTEARWIKNVDEGVIRVYMAFDYVVKHCKKLIIV